MPSQQEVQWSQLKVGVLVIVALAALTALVFLMSGSTGGIFTGKIKLRSYFENAAGIKVGAPVNLEGYTIGNVTAIGIVPARKLTPVEVTMKIGSKYRDAVHTDSTSSLETIGVLGDTVVDINSKTATGPPVQNNARAQNQRDPQPLRRHQVQPGNDRAVEYHPGQGRSPRRLAQLDQGLDR